MDISWLHVRQVLLNDRVNGYKPDKPCLVKVGKLLPDSKILGFGRYYQMHWYLLIESRAFYPSEAPIGARGSVSLSYLQSNPTKWGSF